MSFFYKAGKDSRIKNRSIKATWRAECKICTDNYNRPRAKNNYYLYYMLFAASKRAKKKGLIFSLSEEDIIIPSTCPLLGIPIMKGDKKISPNSPSLDRIDNTKGYIKDNI